MKIEGMSSAAVYAAHRINQGGVQLSEIVEVSKVGKQTVLNHYKKIKRDLGLPIPPPQPREFISGAVSELESADEQTRRKALDLLSTNQSAVESSTRSPRTIAAAAIVSTSAKCEKPYQTTTGEVLNVSPTSIRKAQIALFLDNSSGDTQPATG